MRGQRRGAQRERQTLAAGLYSGTMIMLPHTAPLPLPPALPVGVLVPTSWTARALPPLVLGRKYIYTGRYWLPDGTPPLKCGILVGFCLILHRSLFPLLLHAASPVGLLGLGYGQRVTSLFLPTVTFSHLCLFSSLLLPLPLSLAPGPAPSPIPGRTRPTGRPYQPENWTPPQQCSRRGKP